MPDGAFIRLPMPDAVLTINLGVVGMHRGRADEPWQPFPRLALRGVSAAPTEGRDPTSGGIAYLSVVIAPWAVAAYLGVPSAVVAGRIVDASVGCPTLDHLAMALSAASDTTARLDAALLWLSRRSAASRVPATTRDVLEGLHEDHAVQHVAASCGVSVRRVHQICTTETGLSPSVYRQVARFARLMVSLHSAHPAAAWSDFVRGYADHSHAIRSFRRHAGTTPRQYFATRRRVPRTYSIVPME